MIYPAADAHSEFVKNCNLGILLISFFHYYGYEFNYATTAVIVKGLGELIHKKRDADFLDLRRPYLLAIENPQLRGVDVGWNSYYIMKVRVAFTFAYKELTFQDSKTGAKTLLGRIFPHTKRGLAIRSHMQKSVAPKPVGYKRKRDESAQSANSGQRRRS